MKVNVWNSYKDQYEVTKLENARILQSWFHTNNKTLIDGGAIYTGSITAVQIASKTIKAGNIEAGTITANEIASRTITADRIKANVITANEILGKTITAAQIAATTITAAEIAVGSLTGDRLKANTITTAQLAANCITANEILAGVITATHIKAGTITSKELAADSVTATQIAANAVVADKIMANAVTTVKIAAEAVTATEIKTSTITAKQIAAGTITANEIASQTITATQILASTITADKLNITQIFSDSAFIGKIQAVELNASKITTGTLSAARIAVGSLNGDRITVGTLDAKAIKAGTLSFDQAKGGTLRLGEDGGGDLVVYDGRDADGSLIPVGAINSKSAEFPNLTSPNIKGNVVNTNTVDTTLYVDNVSGNDNNNGLTKATAFRTVQAAINSLPKYIARNVDIVMTSSGADQVENVSIKGFMGGAQLQLRSESGIKTLVGAVDVFGCSVFVRIAGFKINTRNPSGIYIDKCISAVVVDIEVNGNKVAYQGINIYNSHAEVVNCQVYNVTNDCIKAALGAHVYVQNCKGGGANAMYGLTCVGAVMTGSGSAPTGYKANWLRVEGGFMQEGSWSWDSGSAPPVIPPVTEQTVFIDSVGCASWRNNGDPRGWYSTVDAVQGTWNTYGPSYGIWWFGDRLEFLKGKTIIGMWVSVARNAGGWSAADSCSIHTHSYRSRPGDSQPWMSGELVRTPPMVKGDRIWVDVTSLGRKLTVDNDRGGFGVQAEGNGSTPFLRMDAWMQVKVTYK